MQEKCKQPIKWQCSTSDLTGGRKRRKEKSLLQSSKLMTLLPRARHSRPGGMGAGKSGRLTRDSRQKASLGKPRLQLRHLCTKYIVIQTEAARA